MKPFLLIVTLAFIGSPSICADTLPVDSAEVVDSTLASSNDSLAVDSLLIDPVITVDTTIFSPGQALFGYRSVSDSINREQSLSQRPMMAMFKSMALPGWGQYGNKRYIKAIFYLGLETWMVGASFHYNKQTSEFRDLFDATPTDNIALRNDYYGLYKDRKDERSKYIWLAVIVSFVSMFDAYVDAHLSGFPRQNDGDLTFSIEPTVDRGVRASLSIGF